MGGLGLNCLMSIIQMYFRQVSSSNILHGELDYRCFPKEDFDALSLANMKYLSETETKEIYLYLSSRVDKRSGENGQNVFRALKELVSSMLLIRDNKPLCQYGKLIEWHRLTRGLGEDLAVCAFLAWNTENTGYFWKDFEWDTVIGHDNMQLNRIMQRGLSDNHFHLFGSAPAFKLSWMKLMNDLDNHKYSESLREIDRKKRVARTKYAPKYKEDSLEFMHFQAALIRAVLFYYLTMCMDGKAEEACKVVQKRQKIQALLLDERRASLHKGAVQLALERMRMIQSILYGRPVDDYAQLGYGRGSINQEFAGERAFLYQMLLGRAGRDAIPEFMMNWFYAYLVIQSKIREEIVQVNQNIGFENFMQYSGRKSGFLYTPEDDRKMVRHAVLGSFAPGNIRCLEVRMTPGKTAEEMRDWIRVCDSYISGGGELSEEQLKHIYYVLHFAKEPDDKISQKEGLISTCRHNRYRDGLEQKARQLIILREKFPHEAARVLGIDACSQEIGCRPEVFAPIFRRLSNHVASSALLGTVKQWKITYHVGEDWIDFADGLRAIDEAVLFLNMRNGDRLGHATVLGLGVEEWYQKKCKNICLPIQDYLDNVAWLYHKLIEFDIGQCETLKGFLQCEFERYFRMLYEGHLDRVDCQYDMNTYYEAWKLRGDAPALYQKGQFSKQDAVFQEHWTNRQLLGADVIRSRKEAVGLMHLYHYSASVRQKGEQVKDFMVPDYYIDGIEKVQKAMQQCIAELGIGIEANPSSNFMISTMDSYEDHPISKLYNMGLVINPEELQECGQLHVSINTDDKGIFQTSLENEYALMGCALEHVTDGMGKKKYQKQFVYEWLDHIREHGNQQSFLWEGN